MSRTKNGFILALAKGSNVSIPKAARVTSYLISCGIPLDLAEDNPRWGLIMEFPLYEINDDMEIRSYHTKNLIPIDDDGAVVLHRSDGQAHRVNVKDLMVKNMQEA